ncbi:MAG: ferritin [Phycisphaerales bacterium]|nr:MAG: ferritin [Phycisphaerales bacterium]
MMNSRIENAFNEQLNAELFSSYLYLSMAAYFESQNLKGMAAWMQMQAQEEHMHGMKFFDFINERGGRITLTTIKEPQTEWGSPLAVFEETCEHEAKVTSLIHNLVDLSLEEKDHAANTFLQWFVTEQVEEESTAQEIRDKLRLVKDNTVALFMIDQELGRRRAPAAGGTEA